MDSLSSTLPDWWGRMIQALRERRPYTWHVLTSHVEPSWETGTLTLTFPTWFAAVQWKARWCDDTLREIYRGGGFPVQDVRIAWQTPAYAVTEWPGARPVPASPLEALEIAHVDACMAYGIDSPEALVAREAYIAAEHHRRRELRGQADHEPARHRQA